MRPAQHPTASPRRGRWLRRIAVLVVGLTLVLIGIALLVLPGPGVLTILAGVAVLSTEFAMARRARRWLMIRARQTRTRLRAGDHRVRPPSEAARGASGMEPPA